MKTCVKCGETKELKSFANDKNRNDGKYVYCKVCVKEMSRQRYLKNKDKINEQSRKWKAENKEAYRAQQKEYFNKYMRTPKGKYQEYKSGAQKRGYDWKLTLAEFKQFWQLPCTYCDDPIDTIGLDRIHNDVGYELNNIVPCCSPCNVGKAGMSRQSFIERAGKIFGKASKSLDEQGREVWTSRGVIPDSRSSFEWVMDEVTRFMAWSEFVNILNKSEGVLDKHGRFTFDERFVLGGHTRYAGRPGLDLNWVELEVLYDLQEQKFVSMFEMEGLLPDSVVSFIERNKELFEYYNGKNFEKRFSGAIFSSNEFLEEHSALPQFQMKDKVWQFLNSNVSSVM